MASYVRKQLGEEQPLPMTARDPAELASAELISVAWAHHVHLLPGIAEESCWETLQGRLVGIRVEDLGFHELSLLLVVLKDAWASGWATNRSNGIDHVKVEAPGVFAVRKAGRKS